MGQAKRTKGLFSVSVWHRNGFGEMKWHFLMSSFDRSRILEVVGEIPQEFPVKIEFDQPNQNSLSGLIFKRERQ